MEFLKFPTMIYYNIKVRSGQPKISIFLLVHNFILVIHKDIYQNNDIEPVRVLTRIKEDTIMAYVISDECVSCGTCAAECPAEAISEGAEHFEIDADACLDCGTCADACPTEAIHPAE